MLLLTLMRPEIDYDVVSIWCFGIWVAMFNVTRDDSVKTRHLRPNDCLCEMRSLVDGGKGCLLLGKGFMTYSHLASSKYIP
jgi:hypothetical protein